MCGEEGGCVCGGREGVCVERRREGVCVEGGREGGCVCGEEEGSEGKKGMCEVGGMCVGGCWLCVCVCVCVDPGRFVPVHTQAMPGKLWLQGRQHTE